MIKINLIKFPILASLVNNNAQFKESILSEINNWPTGLKKAKYVLALVENKRIPIYYLSEHLHNRIISTENFLPLKEKLIDIEETCGLLLFPKLFFPSLKSFDSYEPHELKVNSILFTFNKQSTHDFLNFGKAETFNKGDYDNEEEYRWEKERYEISRWLEFLPIQLDKVFFIDADNVQAVPEEYGTPFTNYGRDIYGNFIDYLFSFILMLNFKQEIKKTTINNSETNYNIIEILEKN